MNNKKMNYDTIPSETSRLLSDSARLARNTEDIGMKS